MFKVKENPDSSILKHKAQLVAKGFLQLVSFDFTKTFSLVVKPITIRIVLIIALSNGWYVRQLDVNNAFLNGDLQEEVYMEQPAGFENSNSLHLVCQLHKALYGLKQTPRTWFEKLRDVLVSLGFMSSKFDHSLFIRHSTSCTMFVLVYVDDILVTRSFKFEIQALV